MVGSEGLLPLRGSPTSSEAGSRKGSPARPTHAALTLQTSGLSLSAAFVAGLLVMACIGLATGALQWSRVTLRPLHTWAAAPADSAAAAAAAAPPLPQLPRLPWPPLLSEADVQRGLTYYGTGARVQAVAAKLLGGQPIKAYTLGGSVTKGQGARAKETAYPHRFFEFIRGAFPHSGHELLNKGIGGTSSGVFSACAEQLVAPDADLVVVEFSVNDKPGLPLSDPQRKGFEQLLRKLLRLPGRPAVVLLHHYAWWRASGDGRRVGLFYNPQTEEQFTLFAQYYDLPSLSVRAALHPLMAHGVDGFRADKVTQRHRHTPSGAPLPAASWEERDSYFYADRTHPNDRGHQMLAELLAGLLLRAAGEHQRQAAAAATGSPAVWARRSAEVQAALAAVPPPMIPGNAEVPTSLCAIQEAFQPMVVTHQGFVWRAERPEEDTFVGQKWGWTGLQPGDWAELEFDSTDGLSGTRDAAPAGAAGAAAAAAADAGSSEAQQPEEGGNEEAEDGAGEEEAGDPEDEQESERASSSEEDAGIGGMQQADPAALEEEEEGSGGNNTAAAAGRQRGKQQPDAEVLLSHLKSYEGMGVAQVRCVSGCCCTTTYLDGTWTQQATLQYIHRFKVSQHPRCRVRLRIMGRPGAVPQEGHKVTLMGLMVSSSFPLRLHTRADHAEQLSNITRRL